MELLAVVIVLAVVVFLIKQKAGGGLADKCEYYSKKPMSDVEQVAYWRLKEACGADKVVLSQVAFSSFIKTKGRDKAARSGYARARQKVADFVICNKDFSIIAIVEVDDSTHSAEKDKARDAITESAGIPTFRIEAKKLPSAEELKEAMKL
jgi:hypothetical protein